MFHRLILLSTLMILACPGALAQDPFDDPPIPITPRVKRDPIEKVRVRMEKNTDYVTILDGRLGRRVLVVDYPWKAFEDPSIEVRLVTAEKPNVREIKPIMFVPDFFKAETKINVFRCRDQALSYGSRAKMKDHGIEFEIIGHRNSLARPAVCIAHKFQPHEGPAGSIAAFCLLDSWSMNRGLLHLDLPLEYFSKKGKLYVWFLRGDRILWQEIKDWPGMGLVIKEEEEEDKEVVQKGLPQQEPKKDAPLAEGPAEDGPFEDKPAEDGPFGDKPAEGDPFGGGDAESDPFGG